MKPQTYNKLKLWLFPLWLVWCFPQLSAGYIATLLFGKEKKMKDGIEYYWWDRVGGVSLGFFLLINNDDDITVRHEFGHAIQSLILGWLYLIVIGIPSAIRAWYANRHSKDDAWYYGGFPENWADKLGGAKRN